MKVSIIILMGAIGLAGCAGFHRTGDEKNEGFSYTHSGKRETPPHSTYNKPHKDPSIRDLPEKAQDILNAVGINDIVLVAAVDKNGNIRLLKPRNVTYRKAKFPLRNKDILRGPTLMSAVTYEGSPRCTLWSNGAGPDGPGKESGESWEAGGMRIDGIFCLIEE